MAHYLFTLGQDDNEKATRCFQFAKIAREKEHAVNIFFVDGGVMWADSTKDFTIKTTTGTAQTTTCLTWLKIKFPSVSEFHAPRLVRLTRINFSATWF